MTKHFLTGYRTIIPDDDAKRSDRNARARNYPLGPILRKKGTWREAKFPWSFAMVSKVGLEPPRVSPPPPQDGVSVHFAYSAQLDDRINGELPLQPLPDEWTEIASSTQNKLEKLD
jgi:hypothetical protein